MPNESTRSDRGGWWVVAAYALVCAATQLLWLTYATITTETARRYGVSSSAVGWLAEIFPLLYVALAIPAGILLDRSFRAVLSVGAVLVAAGGLIRLGGQTFAWAMAGQVAVAVAQPVVLSAVGKLAAEHLSLRRRADGIALGSAGSFVGMLVALILGPTFGGHGHLQRLLVLEAAVGVACALALVAALRRPGQPTDEQAAIARGTARSLWAMPAIRTVCALVFIGFGVFVAMATWLQTLLQPEGVSETAAGTLLVGMVLAGVVGCAVLPARVAREARERSFMRLAVLVSCGGCALLAALPWLGARAVVLALMGLVLLPALPVVLTSAERLAGPAAGTAGAIVWMAGNLGGLAVALIVQILVHEPVVAFLAMAAVSLCGLAFVAGVPAGIAAVDPAAQPAPVEPELAEVRFRS